MAGVFDAIRVYRYWLKQPASQPDAGSGLSSESSVVLRPVGQLASWPARSAMVEVCLRSLGWWLGRSVFGVLGGVGASQLASQPAS